jgi:hypothetical protein
MKRILVGFSPLLFVFFVACGGKDSPPPAAPAGTLSAAQLADDPAQAQQLQNLARKAYTQCQGASNEFASAAFQPGGPFSQIPFPPPPGLNVQALLNQSPVTANLLNGNLSAPQNGCVNALREVTAFWTTFRNGTFAQSPAGVQWFIQNVPARIGDQFAQVYPAAVNNPDARNLLMQTAGVFANQRILPQLNSGLVNQYRSSFPFF